MSMWSVEPQPISVPSARVPTDSAIAGIVMPMARFCSPSGPGSTTAIWRGASAPSFLILETSLSSTMASATGVGSPSLSIKTPTSSQARVLAS